MKASEALGSSSPNNSGNKFTLLTRLHGYGQRYLELLGEDEVSVWGTLPVF